MKSAVPLFVVLAVFLVTPPESHAQGCVDLPSGLVSWWPADGDAIDTAGDNEGTLQNGAGFDAGVVGSAFLLDGIDDHILVLHDPTLDLQEFTFEAWIRTSQSDNHFIATKSGSTGNFGYELGIHTSGRGRFTLNGAADNADVFSASSISDGGFHHVAGTYDGHRLKFYVDGVLAGRSLTTAMVVFEADSPFFIGARDLGTIPGYWPGIVDELTLYSRALCGAEVGAIYDAGSAGKCHGGIVVTCPLLVDGFDLGNTGEWTAVIQ